ncbi:hypothetical protein BT63DRAFT_422947 [Microthyrium microscopicum]|uniref:Uncharacterized protein n=1 Tax=Microthyrium microscopicum TaxID=703497 RepID=A0A6A6UJS3_9PEZI|nr:hypothetical protein BT63DRAFT_422947 [Microthyrium microscopicum]
MDSQNRRNMRLFIVPATGLVVASLATVNLVFMTKDSNTVDLGLPSFKTTSIAAAALNGATAVTILATSVTHSMDLKPRVYFRAVLGLVGAVVALASMVITVNIIILKRINPSKLEASKASPVISTETELIAWALYTAFTLAFYVLLAALPHRQVVNHGHSTWTTSTLSFYGDKKTSNGSNITQSPPTPLRELSPPIPQVSTHTQKPLQNNSRRSSWRDSLASLQQVVRPSHSNNSFQSRKRLLNSGPSTARSSYSKETQSFMSMDSKSITNTERSDTLDSQTWDLWCKEVQIGEQSSPTARKTGQMPLGTSLETIPGSRPSSPGKPLDGPFAEIESQIETSLFRSPSSLANHTPTTSTDHLRPIPRSSSSFRLARDFSPNRPSTHTSSSASLASLDFDAYQPTTITRPPTAMSTTSTIRPSTSLSVRRPVVRIPSRPTTPAVVEAHIHPLFRTDSPTPPPNASANTVVHASPFSGQVIGQVHTPGAANQTWSSVSARSYTSVRAPSRSNSRLGERIDEDAVTPSSYFAGPGSRSGSGRSTPTGTKMAIPDFVLGVSKERLI